MTFPFEPVALTPTQYELAVKGILDGSGVLLEEFTSNHLDAVKGVDGSYVIDVTARFTALGASFLVLIECKHERRKVERQAVQVLHAKMRSTGAQKGMLFSVAGFQSGAVEYATVHGIALIQMADESSTWFTRSFGPSTPPPGAVDNAQYVGWWCRGNEFSVVSADEGKYTRRALGIDTPEAH
ncbi:restriction endonuclease [Massilia yuzhufengensis]|uniref:restriction endonuclease n=1 Tax=Massilia yuzhufengensis TaxID=1164594 RepID=UPI000B8383F1|nr:restriction endonuclease [Massilia yuzhufengensis]